MVWLNYSNSVVKLLGSVSSLLKRVTVYPLPNLKIGSNCQVPNHVSIHHQFGDWTSDLWISNSATEHHKTKSVEHDVIKIVKLPFKSWETNIEAEGGFDFMRPDIKSRLFPVQRNGSSCHQKGWIRVADAYYLEI